MMKRLLTLSVHILLSLLCVGFGFYLFLSSTVGLHTTLLIVKPLLPGKLSISEAKGSLLTGVKLQGLKYDDSNYHVVIQQLETTYQLHLSSKPTLLVDFLKANGVHIQVASSLHDKNTWDATTLVPWVKAITILHARIDDITMNNLFIKQGRWDKLADHSAELHLISNLGNLDGSFSLFSEKYLQWNINAAVSALNPAYFAPGWQGHIAFNLQSDGTWKSSWPDLSFHLSNLKGQLRDLPLSGVADIKIDNHALTLKNIDIQLGRIYLHAIGTVNEQANVSVNLDIPELKNISSLASGSLKLKGRVTGQANHPVIRTAINLHHITSPLLKVNSATADAAVTLDSIPTAIIHLTSDSITIYDVSLKQSVVDAKVAMAGKLTHPTVYGHGKIAIQSAFVSDLGVTIQNAVIHLDALTPSAVTINGSLRSGKGSASFTGTLNPSIKQLPLALQVTGHDLTLVNLTHYKINGSPHLSLHLDDKEIAIEGSVFIPSAEITSSNLPNVVNLPPEAVVIKQHKVMSPITTMPNLKLALNVILGKHINIAYDNLASSLEGKAELHQTPGRPLTAIGEFNIKKGKYTAYGKTLAIKTGRLIYSGNTITNPGLDLLALSKFESTAVATSNLSLIENNDTRSVYNGSKKIKVGVSVKGTVNQPIIDLVSEPQMNREDILSYLIFGYPRSQVTDISSLALLSTLSTDGGQTKKNIYNKLQSFKKNLSISKLEVGNTNYFDPTTNQVSNATTLNVSKKIGNRLSINYSMGLFTPLSILGVRYQLNKHYVLQSQTSNMDSGADIFYEVERD